MIAFVITSLIALGNGPTIVSAPPEPSTVSTDKANLGSCRGDRKYVDLGRVMFLKNNEIDVDHPDGKFHITLDRQKIRIQRSNGKADNETHVLNVGNMLDGEPDIVLTLGLLDHRFVLYWKETFLHRSHRQGLFQILGQSLVPLCQGVGGGDLID
jgi:hypothetical protein